MINIMKFVKPICIAMILEVMVTLFIENYIPGGQVSVHGLIIGVISFIMLRKYKWSVPKVIVSAVVLGVLFFGVLS